MVRIDEKAEAKRRRDRRRALPVPTPSAPAGPETASHLVEPQIPCPATSSQARPSCRSILGEVGELTRSPGKAKRYAEEPYVRESWADLAGVLGAGTPAAVLQHGLVMLKPDGLALGRTRAALSFFHRNGFRVVESGVVEVTALQWRTMWTYQLTQATLDRILLNDLIMRGPGLVLLLRSERPDPLPAAVRLSLLKGPAVPERQTYGCLRRAIGQPNRIFSLVHSADEPLDVVRELGLLLDARTRRRFAAAMHPDSTADAGRRVTDLPTPRRDFDPAASAARIRAAVVAAGPIRQAAGLRAGIAALAGRGTLDFTGFLALVEDAALDVDPWDLAVAASAVIRADDEDGAKLIDNLGPEVWH